MFCAKCGVKVSEESKFCPKCGKSYSSSAPKKRKTRWWMIILGLIMLASAGVLAYFYSVPSNKEFYTHPSLGFTLMYPKNLIMETPTLPDASVCSESPCGIVFKNPSYNNEAVNWIIIFPAEELGGKEAVSGMTKEFQEDVEDGKATTMTVGTTTVYYMVNDPVKGSEDLLGFYKTFGFDASREKSVYAFIINDAVVFIGVRTPPTGAPEDYDDYVDVEYMIIP